MSSHEYNRISPDEPRQRAWAGDGDDLLWQAFLYSTNELAADDAECFEVRLAEDQLAREALAEAVQLGIALSQASKPSAAVPRAGEPRATLASITNRTPVGRQPLAASRRAGWTAWAVAAAAVCLAIAVSLGPWVGKRQNGQVADTLDATSQGELALAWVASADVFGLASDEEHSQLDSHVEPTNGGLPTAEFVEVEGGAVDGDAEAVEDGVAELSSGEALEIPDYYALLAELDAEAPPAPPANDESKES